MDSVEVRVTANSEIGQGPGQQRLTLAQIIFSVRVFWNCCTNTRSTARHWRRHPFGRTVSTADKACGGCHHHYTTTTTTIQRFIEFHRLFMFILGRTARNCCKTYAQAQRCKTPQQKWRYGGVDCGGAHHLSRSISAHRFKAVALRIRKMRHNSTRSFDQSVMLRMDTPARRLANKDCVCRFRVCPY